MKKSKLLFVSLLIIPWLTVPFLGRHTFKRYLPASLFICILIKILDLIGTRKKWWKIYKGISPLNSMDILICGPYLVTSLWMLKMTYGKFPLFIISNTILHSVFIFLGLKYLKRFRILSLEKLSRFQYLLIDFFRALLLYGFQLTSDKLKQSNFNTVEKTEDNKVKE
jgi:hypothetical protein